MLAAYFVLLGSNSGVPEEAGAHNELPMPAEAFGLTALAVFAALLLVTWAFRSAGTRH